MSDTLAFTLGALIGAVAVGHFVLLAVVLETVAIRDSTQKPTQNIPKIFLTTPEQPENLQMAVQTTVATGGSIAIAAAVLSWALGQMHINVPADVAVDMVALAAPVVHWAALRYGTPDPLAETPPNPAPAPNPPVA